MVGLPSDKTLPLLFWLFLLGAISLFSTENIPVVPQKSFEKINLNEAKFEDLMAIPRLSARIARAILKERDKRGTFQNFEELGEISGVGPKTLEKIENLFIIDIK